jgi:hypothetical protein
LGWSVGAFLTCPITLLTFERSNLLLTASDLGLKHSLWVFFRLVMYPLRTLPRLYFSLLVPIIRDETTSVFIVCA